jgi:hypothetical protein
MASGNLGRTVGAKLVAYFVALAVALAGVAVFAASAASAGNGCPSGEHPVHTSAGLQCVKVGRLR